MTRSQCYETLFRLKKEKNLDIDEPLRALAESDSVPDIVVKFIEINSSRTFSDFINVISKCKPFYTNIVFNYGDNTEKYIKAMLSFLTHVKITLAKNPDLMGEFNRVFDIAEITKVITINLTEGGNDEEIIKCARKIKQAYLNQEEGEEL